MFLDFSPDFSAMGFDDADPLDEGDATGTDAGDTNGYGEDDGQRDDLWNQTIAVSRNTFTTIEKHRRQTRLVKTDLPN